MTTLVIVTRRVPMALIVGVPDAAFIYTDGRPLDAIRYIWNRLYATMTSLDWYLPILVFVVLIGCIRAFAS